MKIPKPHIAHFSFWAKLKYFLFGFDEGYLLSKSLEPCLISFRCKGCSSSYSNANGDPAKIEDVKFWLTESNPRWICKHCGADTSNIETYIGRKRSVLHYATVEWIRPDITESFEQKVLRTDKEIEAVLTKLTTKRSVKELKE